MLPSFHRFFTFLLYTKFVKAISSFFINDPYLFPAFCERGFFYGKSLFPLIFFQHFKKKSFTFHRFFTFLLYTVLVKTISSFFIDVPYLHPLLVSGTFFVFIQKSLTRGLSFFRLLAKNKHHNCNNCKSNKC
jgi:hypothetical protein